MKQLLCLLVFVLPLMAATPTATITVPDAQEAQLAVIFESLIQAERNQDGSLRFPGATVAARQQSLFNTIFRDGVRKRLQQACRLFPRDCPTAIKTARDARKTADGDVDRAVDDIVQ